ncbi:uncharacterized protein LOC141499125 [Macrotis lagotis]|uniref:uncharacterized protein LOC141499125 n=1 Tax=Macrotis lagotis TaxID=92651 RepID=UPI003D6935C3
MKEPQTFVTIRNYENMNTITTPFCTILYLTTALKKSDSIQYQSVQTPLHWACAYGYPDVVTLLVARKCHLNPRDLGGLTPLMRAIQGQREQCTSILLKHGADPKLADTFNNNTLLHYAAYGQNTAIVSELQQYNCDFEAQNKDGFTPLLLAVKENNKEMVEFFLMNGANVNAVDNNQRTPLHLGCVYGYPDVVTLLVERKCHLNPCDLEGLTPLMRAIQCEQEECISILLKHGADTKLADTFNNNTPLHYAVCVQKTATVSELLQYNCDLEAQNKVEEHLLYDKVFYELKCVIRSLRIIIDLCSSEKN